MERCQCKYLILLAFNHFIEKINSWDLIQFLSLQDKYRNLIFKEIWYRYFWSLIKKRRQIWLDTFQLFVPGWIVFRWMIIPPVWCFREGYDDDLNDLGYLDYLDYLWMNGHSLSLMFSGREVMAVVKCGLPDCHHLPRHPPQQHRKQQPQPRQPRQPPQLRQPLQLPLRQQRPQRPQRSTQEGKTGLTTQTTSIGKNVWCSNGICPIAFGCPPFYLGVSYYPSPFAKIDLDNHCMWKKIITIGPYFKIKHKMQCVCHMTLGEIERRKKAWVCENCG